MKYSHSMPNDCKYYINGQCIRSSLLYQPCPLNICWNDNNENNTLCDFAGYESKNNKEETDE